MRRGIFQCAFAAMSLATFTGESRANFVVNGDFESGAFPPWATNGVPFVGTNSLSTPVATGTSTAFVNTAPGVTGTMTQFMTLTVGQAYRLDFTYGFFPQGDTGGTYVMEAAGAGFDLFFTNNIGSYASHSIAFTALAPATPVTFVVYSGVAGTGVFGIDDVSVTATPLPPTLVAGFLGMALLAGIRRLRRA